MAALAPAPTPWGKKFILALATVGFVGCIPYRLIQHKKWKGSGLLGTLVGWGLLWSFPSHGGALWGTMALLLALSVYSSHQAEPWLTPDDPRIVIDEVIGVWLACGALPRTAPPMVLGFVLFRVFDVWKGPWGRAVSRWPGGWGIVADDVLAGVLAHGIVRGCQSIGWI